MRRRPPYGRACGAFAYGGALKDAIVAWKNRPAPEAGAPLGALFVSRADACGWTASALGHDRLVVPVPSTGEALRRRGFNPAGRLASALGGAQDLEVTGRALRLTRMPSPAKGATKAARARRLSGAFRGSPSVVGGREVLLVDDVMTTGATVTAATRALLLAGARRVDVAVLARVGRA